MRKGAKWLYPGSGSLSLPLHCKQSRIDKTKIPLAPRGKWWVFEQSDLLNGIRECSVVFPSSTHYHGNNKISNFQYYNKTPILRRSLQFIALLSKLTDFKLLSANRSYLFSSKQTIITLSKSSKKLLGFNDRNRSIITIYLTWANLQNLCSERMKIVAI